MTDSETVRTYQSAKRYVELRKKWPAKIPVQCPPTKDDLKILEHIKEIDHRSIEEPLQIMQQAETAIARLPDPEWREVMKLIYIEGLHTWEAANASSWSDRSVFTFLKRAFHYLDTGEILGRERKN